jgi:hypothetical protein
VSERPLHVRVAEAMGCKPSLRKFPPGHSSYWTCTCSDGRHLCEGYDGAPNEGCCLESYDTDWNATGPLIERFQIGLWKVASGWKADCVWPVGAIGSRGQAYYGVTADDQPCHPLIAVCNLILALSEAGKLADPDSPDDGTPPPPPRP